MDTGRHHFVPKFYLRAFSQNARQIHVFNLERREAFLKASLRDQCCEPSFYGEFPGLEERLQKLEDAFAPVVQEVILTQRPPARNTATMGHLVTFIALQHRRSVAAVESSVESWENMRKALGPMSPELVRDGWSGPISSVEAMRLALGVVNEAAHGLVDLHMRTLVAPTGVRFVTSDDPVFLYNQFCEGVHGTGVLGIAQRGLQVFLPVSPEVTVMLFDPAVYKLASGDAIAVTARDVEMLNGLQVLSADESILLSDENDVAGIRRLVDRYAPLRAPKAMNVEVYERVDDPREGQVHAFQLMPQAHLNLSVCELRRRAKRVPHSKRAAGHRANAAVRRDARGEQPDRAPDSYRPRPADRRGELVSLEVVPPSRRAR
ncbi:MAG TPA: DUF4238 domain-containing protein [Candidatus Polarisedimenticolaceae bacterium]|nr:DUF4238 domain-containing protein [Candidatus Polarisedimenticolaceae bacterium]